MILIFLIIILKIKFKKIVQNPLAKKKKKIKFPVLNKTEIINYYLSCISSKYEEHIIYEKNKLDSYFSLKQIPEDSNDPLYAELKIKLLNHISKFQKQNFTEIKAFFILNNIDNSMININNIMNYCDFLDCKNVYLNKKYNWYIKNDIITEKYNISVIDILQINCKDPTITCVSMQNNFWIRPFIIFQKETYHQ